MARALRERGSHGAVREPARYWAWRQAACAPSPRQTDLVLCVLPSNRRSTSRTRVDAVFVGHPLADRVPFESIGRGTRCPGLRPRARCRGTPGQPGGEVSRLGPPFAATVAWLAPAARARFVAPMANAAARVIFDARCATHAPGAGAPGRRGAQDVITAERRVAPRVRTQRSRPRSSSDRMVVAYRVAPLTAGLLREEAVKTESLDPEPAGRAGRWCRSTSRTGARRSARARDAGSNSSAGPSAVSRPSARLTRCAPDASERRRPPVLELLVRRRARPLKHACGPAPID